jgi:hypothetical protein
MQQLPARMYLLQALVFVSPLHWEAVDQNSKLNDRVALF